MSQVLLLNPKPSKRKSKSRTRSHKRRAHVSRMRMNPRRKRRHYMHMARNPRRRHHRRMHRNPRTMKGIMSNTIIPASVGAGGALALNLALGYLPIPAALNTAVVKPLIGLAGALAIGWIGSKVAGKQAGEQMAVGAAAVVLYQAANTALKTIAPTLPLSGPRIGWVNPGLPVGEYVGVNRPRTVQPMGEYVGSQF